MPTETQPLFKVQRAPDGRLFEVINRQTLELVGAPYFDEAAAQRRADALNDEGNE